MPNNFTGLVITWFDASDNYATSANITDAVVGLPLFSDSGTGEVNALSLDIKAPYGKYITSISPEPLDEFDRISIALDDRNGNSYLRFFEIQKLLPGSDKDIGTILTVECIGIEYHTQMNHYSRQFWFASAFLPAKSVGDAYNDNKGTTQPTLDGHADIGYDADNEIGNGLPTFTQGIYDYGVNPAISYDIWMDLIDRQGASGAGGGVFDFFELGFDTPEVDEINFRCFSSGSTPESKTTGNTIPVTIENTLSINPSQTEGDIENQTGTISYVIGDSRAGALQQGREIYNSGIFQFTFRPEFDLTINYQVGALVKFEGQHYISLTANNKGNDPPGPTPCETDADSNWEQIDMSDRFGNSFQYSEWTVEKPAVILNGMCAPDQVSVAAQVFTSTGAGAFDGNIVINANGFLRTYVDERVSSSQTFSNEYFYAGNSPGLAAGFPRGYRFLNEGDGIFPAGSKDLNGILFQDSVVEVVFAANPSAENLVFEVKYKLDADTDKMQIVVIRENKVFEWNNTGTTLTDITTDDLGADCLHRFNTIQNTTSFDPKPAETDCAKFPDVTKDGNPFTDNVDSAIEIVYDFNSVITDRITNQTAYQSHGAWFNLRFPYPVSTFNSITEGVGDIYGGGTNSATENVNEPATLDISNMGYTPSGKLGYSQVDSTRLSKLVTFSFAIGLKIEARNPFDGSLAVVDGTAQIRVVMGDTNDNVWTFDFELTTTDGVMYPIDTQISAYQVIRNHKPRFFTLNGLADLINPKEIDNQNIMETRNIKWIVIQHQDQYDDFGRFAPEGNLTDLSNTSLSAALGGRITMTIDDLHFKKALVVNSGTTPTKTLEPDMIHRQDIMLFDQANEVAGSNQQTNAFRHKEFDITTTGASIFDIRFGDSFFLKNRRLVSDADKPILSAPTWAVAIDFVIGDIVQFSSQFYECIANNTSEIANQPGNTLFWTQTDTELNTIKLVAKKIEYSISRNPVGRGGLERRIKGVKRFT